MIELLEIPNCEHKSNNSFCPTSEDRTKNFNCYPNFINSATALAVKSTPSNSLNEPM